MDLHLPVEQVAVLMGGELDAQRHRIMSDWTLLELPTTAGTARYHRATDDKRRNAEVPFELALSEVALVLLAVLRDGVEPGVAMDTESASGRVAAEMRKTGMSFALYTRQPWFGLDGPARELQDRGLIDIDPGIAEVVPPGAPAPTAAQYFLRLPDLDASSA